MDFLIILCVALGQRLIVRLNEPASYDSYGHLFFISTLKEKNLGPFNAISLERLGVVGKFSHPFLFHWLLGFIPYSFLLKYQFMVNPVLDSLFACFIYYILLLIGFTNYESMLIVMLYVFTPSMFTRLSIGPRTSGFTPRLFSELMGNAFFIFLFFPLPLNEIETVIITSVLASIVMLSSKFGVQAVLFVTPIASLLSNNMNGIYVIFISIILCIIVTKMEFIDNILTQFKHLSDYFVRNINQGTTSVSGRNNLNKLFKILKSKKINEIVHHVITKNSFTGTLIKMPVVVLFLLFVLFDYFGLVNDVGSGFIDTSLIYAAIILFFLINTPWLLFLGEAERYLNFVITFVLTATFVFIRDNESMWLLYALIIYGMLFSIFEVLVFSGLFRRFRGAEPSNRHLKAVADNSIIKKLKKIKIPLRVLSYPYHAAGGWRIVAETKHSIIYPIPWGKEEKVAFNKYEGVYPYVLLSRVEEIIDNYDINMLVIDRKKQRLNHEKINLPNEWYVDKELSSEFYDVFRI